MRPIRNLSIRHKLVVIIMTTSLAALLLACLGFISYERVTFRAKLAQDFWTLADVLDDSLAPGLAFTDPAALQQQLDTLKSHPHVLAAAVYDKTGQRVSAYERDRRARGFPWPAVAREGSFFQPERLDTIKAIPLAGEGVGTLYIAADLGELETRQQRYLLITGAVLLREGAERKQLAAQFLRSQRMEAIGSLAGGIAHDLNNALAPILMASEYLKMVSTDASPETNQVLDTIYESARRGADMVKQILTFARGTEGTRGAVQPKHLIKEMIDITRHCFPKGIAIRSAVAPNIWTVLGHPTQLHQVLLNLCVNARDALPAGGTLTLAVSNLQVTAAAPGLPPDVRPGAYVVVSVKDTGTGMSPAVQARIFEPFFTTKELDRGTGLGLSTVGNIVKDHRGFITVDSTIGEGTEFKVFLPAQPDAAAVVAAERLTLPVGHGEWILVVDDEAAIRSIATQSLEMFGYHVVTAKDGAEGLAVFARHQAPIELVITDRDMPVLDGLTMLRRFRDLAPQLKVILASGVDSDTKAPAPADCECDAYLPKPYSADELLRAVDTVLHLPARP